MSEWFAKRGERVVGPLSKEKLVSYARSGKLRPDDLVGKTKKGPFRRAGDLKGLFPDVVEEEEDYGFPALDGVDLNAGEKVYESYGLQTAYDEDAYEDDDDDYYRTTRRGRRSRRKKQASDTNIMAAGISLIVYNIICILVVALDLVILLTDDDAEVFAQIWGVDITPGWMIAFSFIRLTISILSIIAGVMMLRKTGRIFILVISTMNMVPVLSCCCCTGFPISVWIIVVLLMQETARQFDQA
ncbi:MAG: hypothetical protein KDA65_18275 [Planctomycetaceae bacterium]|nr:hypothetical protein [Planctomycetaceae bacterium]